MTRDEFSGQLRHRLRLQRRIDSPDEGGGVTQSWEDVAVLWGDVRSSAPTRAIRAAQPNITQDVEVHIRYRRDIECDMRFVWRGDALRIQTLHDVGDEGVVLVARCRRQKVL